METGTSMHKNRRNEMRLLKMALLFIIMLVLKFVQVDGHSERGWHRVSFRVSVPALHLLDEAAPWNAWSSR